MSSRPNSRSALTPIHEAETDKNMEQIVETEARKPLRQQVFEIVKDSADRSSIHSFPSLASTKLHWFVKVIWIVCAAASWGYFIYQVNNSVILYTSYNVVSSTSINYDVPADFFAVDICQLNPLRPLLDISVFENFLANFSLLFVNNSHSIVNYADKFESYLQVGYLFLNQRQLYPNESVYYSGIALNEILLSCEYNGVKCTANDFYFYHDFNYGNCFRFNGGPNDRSQLNGLGLEYHSRPIYKSYQSGWRYGLRLELYSPSSLVDMPYTYQNGFRITIHNQSTDAYPDEEGLDVPVGLETKIGVSRTFINRLSKPYSSCIDEFTESRAQENEALKVVYSKTASGELQTYQMIFCLKVCYQLYILKACSCSAPSLLYLNIASFDTICFSTDQIQCMNNASTYYYQSSELLKCYSSCPLNCKVTKYETKISTANYPTTWHAKKMNQYQSLFNLTSVFNQTNITYDLVKSSTAFVNIFYDSMEYTMIQESPTFTFDLLLANIGGNLGLFTGMSVLSIVEFVEVLMSILIIRFFICKNRISPNTEIEEEKS